MRDGENRIVEDSVKFGAFFDLKYAKLFITTIWIDKSRHAQ